MKIPRNRDAICPRVANMRSFTKTSTVMLVA